jgi:hypothetical protein
MLKKSDHLLVKSDYFPRPGAISRTRSRPDLPRRGPLQGAHAERGPGERKRGRRLLPRPSLAGREVGPSCGGTGIGAQLGPSHLPGGTEAARAGGPSRRPERPGEAAAERPGWAGRDEGGAGPPGRRCPGLHRASTVSAQAGRDSCASPRSANSGQRRARLDMFRPENVNTGQKMRMPAGKCQSRPRPHLCWPGHKYAGRDPPMPTRGRICRPRNVDVDPGRPNVGPGELTSAREAEEDLKCSEAMLMSSPRADEEDLVRIYSYQRLDQPHGGRQMSSW